MGKYQIELTDAKGNSGRIELSLPFAKVNTNPANSKWRVMDEGFLKFRSGGCRMKRSKANPYLYDARGDLFLFVVEKHGWGIVLFSFLDEWSLANDSGDGEIAQPWVINCKPGDIGWVLV